MSKMKTSRKSNHLLSLVTGIVALSAMPVIGLAAQFVLLDVTFTYTKEDADNSKPSKSHYYVRGDKLNPDRPRDWTSPVDYRNGTVHIRTEVIEKPEGAHSVCSAWLKPDGTPRPTCTRSLAFAEVVASLTTKAVVPCGGASCATAATNPSKPNVTTAVTSGKTTWRFTAGV